MINMGALLSIYKDVVECYNDIRIETYRYALEFIRKFYFNLIFKEKMQTCSFVRVGNIQERCYEYL